MGQNAGAALGSHGREDTHKFYPWEVVIVHAGRVDKHVQELADAGFLTLRKNEGHFLAQNKRGGEAIDEDMVASMAPTAEGGSGQLQPIRIMRDGPDKLIVVGRNRTKAIAERCWRIAEAAGKTRDQLLKGSKDALPMIAALVFRGSPQEAWRAMQDENVQRRNLDAMEVATEINRGLQLGVDLEIVARTFKVDAPTAKLKLRLLDLAKPVQDAIVGGELPESTGYIDFVKWTRDDQVKNLADMRAAGTLRGSAARQAISDIKAGKKPAKDAEPVKRAPNKVIVSGWIDALKDLGEKDRYADGMRAGMMKALGRVPRGVPDKVKEILGAEE